MAEIQTPKIVTSRAILGQLSKAADIHIIRVTQLDGVEGTIVVVGPVEPVGMAKFFVMAALILGGADALMLALIAQASVQDDAIVMRFPGWEVF